jgi:hypothetical protein
MFETEIHEARALLATSLGHWNKLVGQHNPQAVAGMVQAEASIIAAMRSYAPRDYPQALAEIEKLKGHVLRLVAKVETDGNSLTELSELVTRMGTELLEKDALIDTLKHPTVSADEAVEAPAGTEEPKEEDLAVAVGPPSKGKGKGKKDA